METAEAILAVYDAYQAQFGLVTRRAAARFIQRDWRGGQQDAMERLTLYRQFVNWVVQDLKRSLGPGHSDLQLWQAAADSVRSTGVLGQPNPELALTFFNSVARQLVRVVGTGVGRLLRGRRLSRACRRPPSSRRCEPTGARPDRGGDRAASSETSPSLRSSATWSSMPD